MISDLDDRRRRRVVAVRLAIGLVVLGILVSIPRGDSPPAASLPTTPPTAGPAASGSATDIACTPPAGEVPPALAGDPCPDAIVAVRVAVAPVRLPINRIVIEPGPFYCDVIWPGAQSAPPCYAPDVIAGMFMHAWVTFERSTEVAAVALGRNAPPDLGVAVSPPPEWRATLVSVQVPPAGWSMP